jgi:molybdopterin converting factor subunit 1
VIVKVQLFARARELAGAGEISLQLKDRATVCDLRTLLFQAVPALGSLTEKAAISVDNEFADDSNVLTEQSVIALIPPVSGGEMR